MTALEILTKMEALREKRRTQKVSRRSFLLSWGKLKKKLCLTPEWELLRKAAARQANGYCQAPNCKQRGIQVHHVVPVAFSPERTFDLTNVQWLCVECHKKEHEK